MIEKAALHQKIGQPWRVGIPGWVLTVAVLATLLGAAFVLRRWGLGRQSLWLDEAMSVYYARLDPVKIWEATFSVEANPPLYYLLLRAWIRLFGSSEIAIRALSALSGALCLLPSYALARRLAGGRAGILAAVATAASPYLLWYSQEARAFALLALLGGGLLYITDRLAQQWRRATAALWAILAILVLYSHFYGAFAVAANAFYLFIIYGFRVWKRQANVNSIVGLAPVLALPGLAYLPWLRVMQASNDPSQNWRASLSAADLFGRSLAAITHNGVLTEQWAIAAPGLMTLLAMIGLLVARRRGVLLGLALVVAPTASYLISLKQPIFSERYLIAIAIPFLVAMSVGAVAVGRRVKGFEVLVGLGIVALAAQAVIAYRQADFGKENFRAAAERVTLSALPEDVIISVADYVQHPFAYYYRGPGKVVGFTGDPKQPGAFLEGVVKGASRVWLLESHWEEVDPEHRVLQWLADRFPIATEAYPRGIHLRAFDVRYVLDAAPAHVEPRNVRFGPIRLVGASFPSQTVATDDVFHPPSNWLPVTLYWQADHQPESDYRPLLQLVDRQGVWGVALDRPGDLFGKVPSRKWPAGKIIVSDTDVNLNPAMPPGSYQLQLAVLDPEGQPLPPTDSGGQPIAAAVPLGNVDIR